MEKLEKANKEEVVSNYEKNFSEDKFSKKIKKYAKAAGIKLIYSALLLYYSLPKLSYFVKAIVLGEFSNKDIFVLTEFKLALLLKLKSI